MPKDAPLNSGAPLDAQLGPRQRVSEMQAKLHRWAAADDGRRFDDLFVRHEALLDRAAVKVRRRGLVAARPRS
ncbi:hypothetical protein [Streptomyces umbrinus]|uniref:hypothetical protein n=1 Tax=Streptomyces umbrinus TaxID=67370 RepID=UPI0033EEF196